MEKKGSDHFRDILNPYGEKSNYGKIGRRRRLSKFNVFFSIILSVTIMVWFSGRNIWESWREPLTEERALETTVKPSLELGFEKLEGHFSSGATFCFCSNLGRPAVVSQWQLKFPVLVNSWSYHQIRTFPSQLQVSTLLSPPHPVAPFAPRSSKMQDLRCLLGNAGKSARQVDYGTSACVARRVNCWTLDIHWWYQCGSWKLVPKHVEYIDWYADFRSPENIQSEAEPTKCQQCLVASRRQRHLTHPKAEKHLHPNSQLL